MDRETALRQFQEEQYPVLKTCRETCIRQFHQNAGGLLENIKKAFSMLPDREYSYFCFSLLRCDLGERTYTVLFQAMDRRWFSDPEPAEWSFRADPVFSGFNEVWDMLLERQRRYMGKLNTYDVDSMVREEIMGCCLDIGNLLRFYFRDVEELPEFTRVRKPDTWQIYWGEYRGDSVLAAQADRVPGTEDQWLQALREDTDGTGLRESFWYQARLSRGNCEKRDLSFAVFEECRLQGLVFKEAVLTGARFRNCLMGRCDFTGADCRLAYFEHCTWEEPELEGTDLGHAVFTGDGIPLQWMDGTQQEQILVREEL